MTQREKKATQSENIATKTAETSTCMLELGTLMRFTVLEGDQEFSLSTPIEGYLNIIVLQNSSHSTLHVHEHHYLLREGENLLIRMDKGTSFELKSFSTDNRFLLIYFTDHRMAVFPNELSIDDERFRHGLLTQSDHRISLALEKIMELYKSTSYIDQLKIQATLIEIVIFQMEELSRKTERKIVNESHYQKIQLAKELIDSDLSKNHTLSDLAKAVGTNNQYLKKYFKLQYGKTVMNYMTERKMEHAKKLILLGKYRITDVARMSGYKHPTHFTTAFKKYFGYIPNSLRYAFLLAYDGSLILPEVLSLIKIA